jgi:hypothetical protein
MNRIIGKVGPVHKIVLLLLVLTLMGCEETDVVAIRVKMEDHSRGTIIVNSIAVPDQAGPVEAAASGADWQQRANLVCAAGSFKSIADLKIHGISFAGGTTTENAGFVQVRILTGPEALWPGVMVSGTPEQIEDAAKVVDPAGNLKLGSTLEIEITLPGNVVAQGTKPQIGKLKSSTDNLDRDQEPDRAKAKNRIARLVLPLDFAREHEGGVVWHVIWEKGD